MIVQLALGLTLIAINAMNAMALVPGVQDVIDLSSVLYKLDKMWELYEIGNGQRLPETANETTNYCAIRGKILNPFSKINLDVAKSALWIGTLKPGVAVTESITLGTKSAFKLNWICETNAWKSGIIINKLATKSKELKSAFTKHMWDLIHDGPKHVTWAHWLCVCQKYINQMVALHPETDNTRQGVMDSLAGHSGAISMYTKTTFTTPDPVCDIQPPKQDKYPLTSFNAAYIHGMNLFYKDPISQGFQTVLNFALQS